ncbi:hypothetical protein MPS_5329 [Mycobacterium pseudoshottsii JCM 15466]|nr:hypothetical protein MPS_5329 [Mycobacterium pseudoshottsii JCM 15466]
MRGWMGAVVWWSMLLMRVLRLVRVRVWWHRLLMTSRI